MSGREREVMESGNRARISATSGFELVTTKPVAVQDVRNQPPHNIPMASSALSGPPSGPPGK
jgi:hypothetical protein